MMKMKYSYAILQYRHDFWSGEALNVGVLLFCRSAGYLSLKTRKSGGRLFAAYPELDRTALTEDLKDIRREFDKLSTSIAQDSLFCIDLPSLDDQGRDDVRMLAFHVLKQDSSSLRWTNFGAGVTVDPTTAHEALMERYVLRHEKERDEVRRDDDEVFEVVKPKLTAAGIADRLESHTVSAPLLKVEFKHAIKNGIWHCVQPLSFDLTTEKGMLEKANNWTGKLYYLKDQPNFRAYLLTGRPSTTSLVRTYQNVLGMLRNAPTGPHVIEEDQSSHLVDQLAAAVHSSGPH